MKELLKWKLGDIEADTKVIHYDRIVIIVKGKTQIAEIAKQLICSCSDGHYITEYIKSAPDEKSQRKLLKAAIKAQGYEIVTYTAYAHMITRNYPDTEDGNKKLQRDYANTIFWIDEAHNITLNCCIYHFR